MSRSTTYKSVFIIFFLLFLWPFVLLSKLYHFIMTGQWKVQDEVDDDNDQEDIAAKERKKKYYREAINLALETEGLSSKESFAIQVGQLAWYRVADCRSKGELLDYMEKQWGFNFYNEEKRKERALYGMKYLWSQGLVDQLITSPSYLDEIAVKDAMAYDSAHFACFIHQLRKLELIDSQEAWGMLFLNAQRVQDCFVSWQEFSDAYVNGYALNEVLENEGELSDVRVQLDNDPLFAAEREQLLRGEWPSDSIFNDFSVLPDVAPEISCLEQS